MNVVGIGGSAREDSTSGYALRFALDAAARAGADTVLLGASDLRLPMYEPGASERGETARKMISALALADAVIISSPGYHGGPSGMVKNALDYIEDLRDAERPYLDGRAVGCIVCAHGWQATTTSLVALRSMVHALRGWPTPLGATINSAEPCFDGAGKVISDSVARQLELVGKQVVQFAHQWSL